MCLAGEGSERFMRFLSGLGSIVSICDCSQSLFLGGLARSGADGRYGCLWRDELTQVFFHVSTLLRHVDIAACFLPESLDKASPQEAEMSKRLQNEQDPVEKKRIIAQELIFTKIWKRIAATNVTILWDESGKEMTEDFFRDFPAGACIVLRPLVTSFCEVRVHKLGKTRYGAIPSFAVVSDTCLSKVALRTAIVADGVVQRTALGKGKTFVSAMLKRCAIMRKIKNKAWAMVRGVGGKFVA